MNIENYLERIKLKQSPTLTEDSLFQIQSSQLLQIPFENIDVLLDRKIHTDLENLQNKILGNQRGGYCFELNGLLSFALEKLGFNYRPLLARVMYRGTTTNSRTHIILLVQIKGKQYITDVGFGGPGTYLPIHFEIDREDVQPHGTFRITRDPTHEFIMQKKIDDGWFNVYGFNLDTIYPADLVMSNFFTSTYPESHFRHNLIAGRHLPNGRITLLNRQLTTNLDKVSTVHEIATHDELIAVLTKTFGIKLEPGMNFLKFFN